MHENGPLFNEELHSWQIPKHLVHDDEEESTHSENNNKQGKLTLSCEISYIIEIYRSWNSENIEQIANSLVFEWNKTDPKQNEMCV